MRKNKICWVTPDCFLDMDLNIPLMEGLLEQFDICWIVLLSHNGRFQKSDFNTIAQKCTKLKLVFLESAIRERNPRKIIEYIKINSVIKREVPDIIYLNLTPASPWQIPMFFLLPKNKTIITAHQGRVHEGMGHYKYYNFLRDIVYNRIRNVNMFSKSQAVYFRDRYSKSQIYQFPLGLKDFGEATNSRPSNGKVRFLSFGSIIYTKSIETLIQAGNILYERGERNFIISINGSCKDWSWYQNQIRHQEVFESDVRMIKNNEIPNLFNGCHYLVQPYRVVSQSGPTKIAFKYNLPVICSNLPGFTDEVIEGKCGYSFETGNPEALADVMQKAIRNFGEYNDLINSEKEIVDANYSTEALIKQYVGMFNSVISRNG